MERDKDNTMDEDIGDVKEEAAEGATGAAAAVVGSETGSGLATNVGGAIVGGLAARELVEDQFGPPPKDPDADDSPDSFAGGGSTSAGIDNPDVARAEGDT